MSFRLIWRNTTYSKGRTFLALSAIAFAVVLIFMQLALFDTLQISAVILLNMLDYDAIILSSDYSNIQQPGSFPRARLYQALDVPGVSSAVPVYLAGMPWRNVEDGTRHGVEVIAVGLDDPVFVKEDIRSQLPLLRETNRVLMDRQTMPFYGPVHVGLVSEAGTHALTVAGLFRNGGGLSAGGLLVMSDRTFNRLGFSLERPTLGLVKAEPGQDVATLVEQLRARVPHDIQILTRDKLAARETYYWLKVKPIGIVFTSGVYIGMLVGAVILYQVLGSDIARRLREYATMKAMGFSDGQINRMVMQQAILYMTLSYLAGLALAFGLYEVMARGAGVPIAMTWNRAILVFGLTLLISLVSGVLAVRKLRAADPAELF